MTDTTDQQPTIPPAALESDTSPAEDAEKDAPQLTDEQRAEIHQRNALVRAWDKALTDMRQRSYEGKLTTPARWKRLAIAPQDMDARVVSRPYGLHREQPPCR